MIKGMEQKSSWAVRRQGFPGLSNNSMGSIEDRVQKQQVQVWDMSTDMENCTTATVSSDLFVPIFILTCYCDMDL